jgi:hypothetical protein
LEVEVQSGAGSGGAFDADPMSDPDTGPRDDVAAEAGQVPVPGDDTVAVPNGNDLSVIRVPISAEDESGSGATTGPARDSALKRRR